MAWANRAPFSKIIGKVTCRKAPILSVLISIVPLACSFYRLYKNFDKMKPSDPLNDDFDEHTDQFVI